MWIPQDSDVDTMYVAHVRNHTAVKHDAPIEIWSEDFDRTRGPRSTLLLTNIPGRGWCEDCIIV